jgi:hypothetical protein
LMPLFAIQAAEYVQFGRHDATATYEWNAYSLERVKRGEFGFPFARCKSVISTNIF